MKLVLNYKHIIALMAYIWISLAVRKSLDKLTGFTAEGCQVLVAFWSRQQWTINFIFFCIIEHISKIVLYWSPYQDKNVFLKVQKTIITSHERFHSSCFYLWMSKIPQKKTSFLTLEMYNSYWKNTQGRRKTNPCAAHPLSYSEYCCVVCE